MLHLATLWTEIRVCFRLLIANLAVRLLTEMTSLFLRFPRSTLAGMLASFVPMALLDIWGIGLGLIVSGNAIAVFSGVIGLEDS